VIRSLLDTKKLKSKNKNNLHYDNNGNFSSSLQTNNQLNNGADRCHSSSRHLCIKSMLFSPVFFHFFMQQYSFFKDVCFSIESFKTRDAKMDLTMTAPTRSLKYLPVSIEPMMNSTPSALSFWWLQTMKNIIVVQSISECSFD
jgi:hypothetical protein